ncbi:MAG: ABC transporter substrate-binding protein [Dorea sp.]|nr:ABC transporter substrate-binding protein [Dorea sp.]
MKKQSKRKVASVMVMAVLLASLAGCSRSGTGESNGDSAAKDGDYVIGLDCPMTGVNASFGEQLSYGAQMAVDEINGAGGINGKTLALSVQDDKSDPKEAATIATKFVADDSIVASIGYYNSSCGLSALPIINEGKLVTIVTGSSPDISEQTQKYGFRTEPSDMQQAVYAADWMVQDGRKKVAILYESTDYGMGQEEIITDILEESGAEIVCSEAYILGETKDFTNILTKVKNSGADSIFLAGTYTEGALIVKQRQSLGMDIPCYSSSSMFEVAFLEAAGEAAEGVKVQGVLVPDDPSETIQKFQSSYKEKFGDDKVAGTFSGHGYATVKMVAEAIENVGTDPDKMSEYIESTTFDAIYGTVSFNETHDLIFDSLKRLVVEDGKFVVVE